MNMKSIRSGASVAGLCGWLWAALPGAVQAGDAWYVATNALHPFNGTSWQTAFTNIQDALDAAGGGDTIYLAGHTFTLTTQLVWSVGKDQIALLGGYEGSGTPGASDVEQWPTVITRDPAFQTRLIFVDGVADIEIARITVTGGYIDSPASIDVPGQRIAVAQGGRRNPHAFHGGRYSANPPWPIRPQR